MVPTAEFLRCQHGDVSFTPGVCCTQLRHFVSQYTRDLYKRPVLSRGLTSKAVRNSFEDSCKFFNFLTRIFEQMGFRARKHGRRFVSIIIHSRVAEIADGQGEAGARLPLHAALAGGRRVNETIDEQIVATNGAVSAVSNTVVDDSDPGRLDRRNTDSIYRRAVD
jgi:hypothetical protein